jgi:hypothetical protein
MAMCWRLGKDASTTELALTFQDAGVMITRGINQDSIKLDIGKNKWAAFAQYQPLVTVVTHFSRAVQHCRIP